MSDYNGWKNRETWNVALHIGSDESLYNLAKQCVEAGSLTPYESFRRELGYADGEIALRTPDGVAWNDSSLDIARLDAMIKEL